MFGLPLAMLGWLLFSNAKGRLQERKFMSRFGVLYETYSVDRYW